MFQVIFPIQRFVEQLNSIIKLKPSRTLTRTAFLPEGSAREGAPTPAATREILCSSSLQRLLPEGFTRESAQQRQVFALDFSATSPQGSTN